MSVSGEPITQCPVCRYDLAGLPKKHICPECGFEYEETMRIWCAEKPSVKSLLVLSIFLLLYIFTLASIVRFIKKGSPFFPWQFWSANWFLLTVCYLLIILVPSLIWYFSRRLPPAFVIVARDSLCISSLPLGGLLRLEWKDIELQGWEAQQFTSPIARCRNWIRMKGELGFRIVTIGPDIPPRTYILPIVSTSAEEKRRLFQEIYQRWADANAEMTPSTSLTSPSNEVMTTQYPRP